MYPPFPLPGLSGVATLTLLSQYLEGEPDARDRIPFFNPPSIEGGLGLSGGTPGLLPGTTCLHPRVSSESDPAALAGSSGIEGHIGGLRHDRPKHLPGRVPAAVFGTWGTAANT
jgi:hypothetical protein